MAYSSLKMIINLIIIFQIGLSEGGHAKKYFADLIENKFVIVAEENKEIIGYLAGYFDETYSYYEGKTAILAKLFIKENYRKSGIGSKLINTFIKWCNENHAKRIIVTASFKNSNAVKFYKKHLFEELNLTLKKNFNCNIIKLQLQKQKFFVTPFLVKGHVLCHVII